MLPLRWVEVRKGRFDGHRPPVMLGYLLYGVTADTGWRDVFDFTSRVSGVTPETAAEHRLFPVTPHTQGFQSGIGWFRHQPRIMHLASNGLPFLCPTAMHMMQLETAYIGLATATGTGADPSIFLEYGLPHEPRFIGNHRRGLTLSQP